MNNISEKTKSIIRKVLDNDSLLIEDETNIIKDFAIDSIKFIMLIIEIEETFSIELPDEFFIIENVSNYKFIVSMIESILNSKNK